ncbi:MAG: L-histidine N(alpha)-methyltransferase [Bacteroidota bacterium]
MLDSITSPTPKISITFAQEVARGLRQSPKKLYSKYFYDQNGDQLFQQIMAMPSYYLTKCEYDIFVQQKGDILNSIGKERFSLIELGAGDGMKTKVLLEHFLRQKVDFQYIPIVISQHVLDTLTTDLRNRWDTLTVRPLQGDYFDVLNSLDDPALGRKVVLFLGSNIGNFERERAKTFLRALSKRLDAGDLLFLGVDLKKDPQVILDAYNDDKGITAAFNLNILTRINRELEGNFNLEHFKHWQIYDPLSGASRSRIVSTRKQQVHIRAIDQYFQFEAWEAIDVELSQKYSLSDIEQLAMQTGFQIKQHFTDGQQYFVNSLWQKQ